MKQQIRNDVNGASERFIDDFIFIFEKMENNGFVHNILANIFVGEIYLPISMEVFI